MKHALLGALLIASAPSVLAPHFEDTLATESPDNILRWTLSTRTAEPTGVQARWRPEGVSGWRYTRCTPIGRTHSIPLWGMRADTTYETQLIDCATGVLDLQHDFTTGALPSGLATVTLNTPCDGCATRYVLLQTQGSDDDGGATKDLLIVDKRGDVIWYEHDTRVQAYSWTDNDTILYIRDYNQLIELGLDGQERRHWYRLGENTGINDYLERDRCFHHEVLMVRGEIWMLGTDARELDDSGETLAYMDEALLAYNASGAAEGEPIAVLPELIGGVLSALPHAPTPTEIGNLTDNNQYGVDACFTASHQYSDWAHVNAFSLDANGDFLISSRIFHLLPDTEPVGAILSVSRGGRLNWAIGDQGSDMESSACLVPTCTRCMNNVWFGEQHHPRAVEYDDNGAITKLRLFDNTPDAANPETDYKSRVIEIALDHHPTLVSCPVSVDIVNEIDLGARCGPTGSAYEIAEGRILTQCYETGTIMERTWGRPGYWRGDEKWRITCTSPADDGASGLYRSIPIAELPEP